MVAQLIRPLVINRYQPISPVLWGNDNTLLLKRRSYYCDVILNTHIKAYVIKNFVSVIIRTDDVLWAHNATAHVGYSARLLNIE